MNKSFLDAISADIDAIVLLENIKSSNYVNVDRFIGFDRDETLAVIKVIVIKVIGQSVSQMIIICSKFQSLAKFHSLCIGMRRQKPELFNSKISPFFEAPKMITYDDDAKILNVNIQFLDNINVNSLNFFLIFL